MVNKLRAKVTFISSGMRKFSALNIPHLKAKTSSDTVITGRNVIHLLLLNHRASTNVLDVVPVKQSNKEVSVTAATQQKH